MKDKTLMWLIGGGAALAGLAYVFREQAAHAIGVIMDEAQKTVFKYVIYPEAREYADIILQVAAEQSISAFLIVELGYRESRWGAAIGGPGGTGDAGHGHGLMQIDDRTNADWLANNDWTDPYTNITKGVQILKGKLSFFKGRSTVRGLTDGQWVTVSQKQADRRGVSSGTYLDPRPLEGDRLTQAAVAAYNTGEGNVLISLAAGVDPDVTTAGSGGGPGNYSSDVLTRMASLISNFNSQVS